MRRNGSASTKPLIVHDILLAAGVLIAALLLFVIFGSGKRQGGMITVTVDGAVYGSWSLNEDRKIRIREGDSINVIRIRKGEADMILADCPDQICVRHRPVSREGETIVCLPHKVVVTVAGSRETDSTQTDVDVISR
ncbi:MAG: NusG domain II-containing protein [Eubacterium sp.]|nr:NusG domain II-containing protein [Eubacterium sp.]